MKGIKSMLSIILAILITLSFAVPTFAQSPVSQTFYIKSVDDLREFSRLASFDKWSKGKTVVLVKDIDLKGEKFNPIPIFRGTFEGNGYKISGINIESEGSILGLFRYLEEGAKIKNLKVEGNIIPKGDKRNIGGIVGYNRGRIVVFLDI